MKARHIARIIFLAVFLFLHMDFWLWDNTTLVFGWWPLQSFYHTLHWIVGGTLVVYLFTLWGMPRSESETKEGEE
jgi:hypothetical protein